MSRVNLTSPSEVRRLLSDLGVGPRKRLGQNFLIDRNILDVLVGAAELDPGDAVLEIGAGLGVVTERLLKNVRHVVAVEKDRKLFDHLQNTFRDEGHLELVFADILALDINEVLSGASGGGQDIRKVVSNLPYSSGTRALVNLIRANVPPLLMVVTVQREVARRLTAGPGESDYGLLSVWAQLSYSVTVVKSVSPPCFWPRPEVTSSIVSMSRRGDSGAVGDAYFYALTKHAFSHRRKQLATILHRAPERFKLLPRETVECLHAMGADQRARPENLGPSQWHEFALMVRGRIGGQEAE